MQTDLLAARLAAGLRPALCYLAPTFQNPSGVVMSATRRQHLAELADRYGFVVVDDDPYRELAFEPPPARLSAFVDPERSVTLGTFSKVVAPGLRVGWVHAPGWLHPHLVRLKQATDLHTSSLGQRMLAGLVAEPGWFDRRAAALVVAYRDRAAALAGALRAGTDRLSFDDPLGGMFLWARLPAEGPTAESLAVEAIAAGVAFVPGAAFTHDGRPTHRMRLCFATLPSAELTAAGATLATVVERAG
jgi:2-aminoadipate transaminase